MSLFRRHLRPFAAAWLVFQATSLSALVPRACCLAHDAHLASVAAANNDEQTADAHCAKPAESATAPSSHAAAHHTTRPTESPRNECAIRGTCGGPAAALFSVISTEGVLATPIAAATDFPPAGAALVPHDQLIRQFEPPDAPPPRS